MANTDPPIDTAADVSALREQAREQAAVPVGLRRHRHQGDGRRGADRDGRAARRPARSGFSDDGLPIRSARVMRRALQYQRLVDLPIALHEEDPELSAGGSMHEGEVSAALGIAGVPSVSESTMIARDCALAAYEEARIHVQHLSAAESVEAIEPAKAAGVAGHLRGDAAPPDAHRRGGPQPRLPLQDEPAAAHRGRPPGADRRRPLRARSTASRTDHAPHASDEKEVPFEQAAMGVTGLETAFAALYTELVLPGRARAGDGGRAARRRRRAVRLRAARGSRRAPRRTSTLVDLDAEWEAGAEGWESRSDNSCFAGRRLRGRVLMTVAAGRVAYRQRELRAGGCVKLDPERASAGRDRRPGGLPQGAAELRRGRRARAATLVEGAAAIGIPIVVTEQYPKGLGATVPEVADAPAGGRRAAREGALLGRRGRGLRPRRARPGARLRDRGARLRQPDRARPARRGRRGPRRRRRGRLAHARPTASSGWRRWSARERC